MQKNIMVEVNNRRELQEGIVTNQILARGANKE